MVAAPRTRVRPGVPGDLGWLRVAGTYETAWHKPEVHRRTLGSYGLVYLINGVGTFSDALGYNAAIGPGDLLFLFPDVAHSYGPEPDKQWQEAFLIFDGPVFDLWRRSKLLDPSHPVRHVEPIDRWSQRMYALVDHSTGPASRAALTDVCDVQALLADAVGLPGAEGDIELPPIDAVWLREVKALLNADVRRERALEDVAREVSMSYDGFRKRFRRLTGTSPARYRAEHSIARALRTDPHPAGNPGTIGERPWLLRRVPLFSTLPPSHRDVSATVQPCRAARMMDRNRSVPSRSAPTPPPKC